VQYILNISSVEMLKGAWSEKGLQPLG